MRICWGVAEAQTSLLRRQPWEEAVLSPSVREKIAQVFGAELAPAQVVERILSQVRSQGDAALFHFTRLLDGVELERLEVPRDEWEVAYKGMAAPVVEAMRLAAERIEAFSQRQKCLGWMDFALGVGEMVTPLERVGIYVPGGGAAYPSTVLMTAIPARVAGVGEVVVATPPRPGGGVAATTLAAAHLAQVDRVFSLGGAQAIAALAYSTETVPRVDKICGPGNIWVVLAKKQVYGQVGIDGLYGPTETVIIADDSAPAALVAGDLLAQAEHDLLATPILITPSASLAEKVAEEVAAQLVGLERQATAEVAVARGGIAVVSGLEEALELANAFAPEHLCLLIRDPWPWLGRVCHAGGVFVNCPEALGDYVAGPSHVMPTGGSARFTSPLGVADFVKTTSLVMVGDDGLRSLGPAAAALARAEGLTGHALSVEKRLNQGES